MLVCMSMLSDIWDWVQEARRYETLGDDVYAYVAVPLALCSMFLTACMWRSQLHEIYR